MAEDNNTLRLEVGKKYRTRDGRVATITTHHESDDPFERFLGELARLDGSGTDSVTWSETGSWYCGQDDWDLVEEIVETPTYRYFVDPNEDPAGSTYVIWRVDERCPEDVEGKYLNDESDAWEITIFSLPELLERPDFVECDESGKPLVPPESVYDFTSTLDRPDVELRTRKLAARILLAGGPAFEWQDLARMTVAELVAALPDHELNCFIQSV